MTLLSLLVAAEMGWLGTYFESCAVRRSAGFADGNDDGAVVPRSRKLREPLCIRSPT